MDFSSGRAIVILSGFPAFKFLYNLKNFWNGSIFSIYIALTIICILLILLSSFLDKTLIINGKAIGFLEHPGIFCFFLLQLWAPYAVFESLKKTLTMSKWKNLVIDREFIKTKQLWIKQQLHQVSSRKNQKSKRLYNVLIVIGLISFVWNSYQNQLPFEFLGFDFWDSSLHPFGYWSTRLFKFYLWVILFPSLAFIELQIMMVIKTILKESASNRKIHLEPYHSDKSGGLNDFIKTIIDPIIPVVIILAAASVAVSSVHREFDLTLVIGLILLSGMFLIYYLIPAYSFRRIIIEEKKSQLEEISAIQHEYYTELLENKGADITKIGDNLKNLGMVSQNIEAIPNWPYSSVIAKTLTFINSPIIIVLLKVSVPIIKSFMKNP